MKEALRLCFVGSVTALSVGLIAVPYATAQGKPSKTKVFIGTGQQLPKADIVYKASSVIGKQVKSESGKQMGEIKDLAVDSKTGQIVYAVVSFDPGFFASEKLFAIPWKALTPRLEDDSLLLLNITQKELESAPGFREEEWPDMADRRWGTEVHRRYGQTPYWEDGDKKSQSEMTGTEEENKQ